VPVVLYYITSQVTFILNVRTFTYLLQTSYNKTAVHEVPKPGALAVTWPLSLALNNDNMLTAGGHGKDWKRVKNLAWKSEGKRTLR
jgi:hypothetical protein